MQDPHFQLFPCSVTTNTLDKTLQPTEIQCARLEPKAFPLDWLLGHTPGKKLNREIELQNDKNFQERIFSRLALLEAYQQKEDPKYAPDYRLAFTLISFAIGQIADPVIEAWRLVHHCRPEEYWRNVVANRKDKLGPEYSYWYDERDLPRPDRVIPDFDPLLASAKHRAKPAGADEAPVVALNKRSAPVPLKPKKEGIA